ncbi:MAG: hypothetical protein HY036_05550 [Nitrospirae bacterium]|nr:hypothetical protein [Nitrospirota bacterium]MBI3352027.1 hypothetical protein [Nitrospirota bacterium]
MQPVLEQQIKKYQDPAIIQLIERYFEENDAANIYLQIVQEQKGELIIDHAAIRCMDVDKRAKEFLNTGYEHKSEMIEYPEQGWWAKVYRKKNHPALFIDQDYTEKKGANSPITPWVKKFGDRVLHHIAVRVTNIDQTKKEMEQKGVEFSGDIIGAPGTRLRQIFTAAEIKNGSPFTVLELTERNNYDGFYPDQADGLMKSSTKTKSA